MNVVASAATTRPSSEPLQPLRRPLRVCGDAATAGRCCEALAEEGLTVAPAEPDGPLEDVDGVLLCVAGPLAEQLPRLREIRAQAPAVPLLVVCRALRDFEQVLALETGADDVVDAQWPAPVLAARLRAIWRRTGGRTGVSGPTEALRFGGLALHAGERRAQLHGHALDLTDAEFDLLWLLASRAGQAVSRSLLLRELRGLEYQHLDRSVDCRVWRLRGKLGDDGRGAAQRIRTVRNCGYLFSPAGW